MQFKINKQTTKCIDIPVGFYTTKCWNQVYIGEKNYVAVVADRLLTTGKTDNISPNDLEGISPTSKQFFWDAYYKVQDLIITSLPGVDMSLPSPEVTMIGRAMDNEIAVEGITVAGFDRDDMIKAAAEAGYMIPVDKQRDYCLFIQHKYDSSIAGWQHIEALAEIFAGDNGIEFSEYIELVEEGWPEKSGDYLTDLGFTYYNLDEGKFYQGDKVVAPICWEPCLLKDRKVKA